MTEPRKLSVCLVALIITALILAPSADAGVLDCWDTWSRCTKWSSIATGILWDDCNDRCKELGHSGGKCVDVKSDCPLSDTALQCQCS